jgi:tRNA(Glu) U13 pseudouridine synthase TruD
MRQRIELCPGCSAPLGGPHQPGCQFFLNELKNNLKIKLEELSKLKRMHANEEAIDKVYNNILKQIQTSGQSFIYNLISDVKAELERAKDKAVKTRRENYDHQLKYIERFEKDLFPVEIK